MPPTAPLLLLALAAMLALGLGLRRHLLRARRDGALSRAIDRSRTRIAALDEQFAAGAMSPESLAAQQHQLAGDLLRLDASAPQAATPRRLPARQQLAAACALLAALAAGAIYLAVDRRSAAAPQPGRDLAAPQAAGASTPAPGNAARPARALSDEQVQRMVDATRAQVAQDPRDAAAWALLAHSYDMQGRFAESSKAYASLARLRPKDAQVLADYADALAVANGRTLRGEPSALIDKALALDPANLKALTLAGTAAYEREDYAQARQRWSRARALSTDPAFLRVIDASLASARAAGKLPVRAAAAPSAPALGAATTTTTATATVSGRVSLADDLVARTAADATVFVFARPVDGSRMPVAILRRHVRDLPLDFTLDDSLAMVPTVRLSQAGSVVIVARVSRRGDVAPQAGDLQGLSAPVPVGARGIKLEISEVLP